MLLFLESSGSNERGSSYRGLNQVLTLCHFSFINSTYLFRIETKSFLVNKTGNINHTYIKSVSMKIFVHSCLMMNSSLTLMLALLLPKSSGFPNERGSLYRCLNRVLFVIFLLATEFSEAYSGSWTDPWASGR